MQSGEIISRFPSSPFLDYALFINPLEFKFTELCKELKGDSWVVVFVFTRRPFLGWSGRYYRRPTRLVSQAELEG
uniref:Uncharacterized protein n=1 Tax=Solanum lycopersicum TaxID=4081 RepID=A0A3Q7HBN4_SOLLC